MPPLTGLTLPLSWPSDTLNLRPLARSLGSPLPVALRKASPAPGPRDGLLVCVASFPERELLARTCHDDGARRRFR
ncbi:hypothetical protein CTA1_4680 [Colletotrichum tanaceti]|uniref:Uncharacterized protein n=1 Tax=Colletotrichum tanaceti TaxID=1306861 RepID=A0A4U6WZJ4_9PEZI|nr:hypothetical protein CTA1_4680 [Colletotrichum tanaceti]